MDCFELAKEKGDQMKQKSINAYPKKARPETTRLLPKSVPVAVETATTKKAKKTKKRKKRSAD